MEREDAIILKVKFIYPPDSSIERRSLENSIGLEYGTSGFLAN